MRSRARPRLALGIVGWPASGLASRDTTASNSQTFTDPTGDSANAPDVSTVTVSNDDAGQITFAITLPNRPALTGSDFMAIDMDTDGDLTNGSDGKDYFVAMDGDGVRIYNLAGNGFEPLPTTSFSSSFANGVQTVSINASAIGNTKQISSRVWTDNGFTFPEDAPDTGLWVYQVTIGPPPPPPPPPLVKLAESKPLVAPALAGKIVTVSAVITNNGEGVKGAVNCSARVGGRALVGARRSGSAAGKASCSWRLPINSRGRQLRGTIGETYQGNRIARPFAATVR